MFCKSQQSNMLTSCWDYQWHPWIHVRGPPLWLGSPVAYLNSIAWITGQARVTNDTTTNGFSTVRKKYYVFGRFLTITLFWSVQLEASVLRASGNTHGILKTQDFRTAYTTRVTATNITNTNTCIKQVRIAQFVCSIASQIQQSKHSGQYKSFQWRVHLALSANPWNK